MVQKFFAIILTLALLASAACLAEESGGADLYSPEVCADQPMAAEAPEGEVPTSAEAPGYEAPDACAVAAPELARMGAAQTVALTGRKASARMNVGETLQIVVGEGETGSFTSKKTNLATVDAAGLVTALAKGKATITFKPDGGKKRTLNITVVDPYEPKGVAFAQGKAVAINVGESIQLGAVLSPDTARTTLTWTSSKAKVAAVDAGGVVTGLGEGKAKITVKTANGKKAKLKVTVCDPNKPSGVSIAEGGAIALYAGESVRLTAGLIPATAISALTWTSSKPKVATVDADGLVTAVGKGKATITVRTANGKKAKCKVTVNKGGAPGMPATPDAPVTPQELIEYLRTRDQTYALASDLNLKKWEPGPDVPVIAVYRNEDILLQIENRHDYFLTVFAASNGKYSLDGVTTAMRFPEAEVTVLSRGWAYGFVTPAYDENQVEYGKNYYYEKNVSNDERKDYIILTTVDDVGLISVTVAIEDESE